MKKMVKCHSPLPQRTGHVAIDFYPCPVLLCKQQHVRSKDVPNSMPINLSSVEHREFANHRQCKYNLLAVTSDTCYLDKGIFCEFLM